MLNMKYRIEKQTTIRAVFEFTPDEYALCKEYDAQTDSEFMYSLNNKIDMSYCGKPDQCGQAILFLTEDQFYELEVNGFEVFDLTQ